MGSKTSKLLQEAQDRGTSTLNLSNNRLSVMAPDIELLKETLQRLSLSKNSLSFLPYEASKLTKLRYVNLSQNKFKMFPTVLCELPNLEVIDLDDNKIKHLPSKLGASLQVLSMANNRITVLSNCILEAPNLKILHVEGNPIVFPPKSILKKRKGISDEDWLVEIKEFMLENESSVGFGRKKSIEPKENSEKQEAALNKVMAEQAELEKLLKKKQEEELRLMGEDSPFHVRRHSSQSSGSGSTSTSGTTTPAMLILKTNANRAAGGLSSPREQRVMSDDCEQMCTQYFRTSDLEKLSGREKTILQACKSLLIADLQIWKAVKQGLQSSSNRNLTKILWRVQTENSQRLIDFVVKMEDCEFKKKANALALKELQTSALALTQSLRRLIKSFLPLLTILTKTTDIRIIKNILLSWSTSVADVHEAIELLTNRFPDIKESPFGMRARSGSNEFLIRGAVNAHDMASDLVQLLRVENAEAKAQGEREENPKFLNTLSGLDKMLPGVEEAIEELRLCLENYNEGVLEMVGVIAGTKSFVHSVSKMLAVAKIVDGERRYSAAIAELLEEATGTFRFLGNCLAPQEKEDQPRPSLDSRAPFLGHSKSVSTRNF